MCVCVYLCVCEQVRGENTVNVILPVYSLNLCDLTSHMERNTYLNPAALNDLPLKIIMKNWKTQRLEEMPQTFKLFTALGPVKLLKFI